MLFYIVIQRVTFFQYYFACFQNCRNDGMKERFGYRCGNQKIHTRNMRRLRIIIFQVPMRDFRGARQSVLKSIFECFYIRSIQGSIFKIKMCQNVSYFFTLFGGFKTSPYLCSRIITLNKIKRIYYETYMRPSARQRE